MSLSGVTAFLSKNKIFGSAADIVRATMLAAVGSESPAPSKGKGKSEGGKAKGKGGKKESKGKVEEVDVSEVTFVKSWTNAKDQESSVIVGPSQDAVAEVRDEINDSVESGGIAMTFHPELKKAGYHAVAIPVSRKKLVDAVESHFKQNKLPIVSNLDELAAGQDDASEEEQPKSKKAPAKPKKGKKQVDESEEEEVNTDDEADDGDAEESKDESEEEPPKKGGKKNKK